MWLAHKLTNTYECVYKYACAHTACQAFLRRSRRRYHNLPALVLQARRWHAARVWASRAALVLQSRGRCYDPGVVTPLAALLLRSWRWYYNRGVVGTTPALVVPSRMAGCSLSASCSRSEQAEAVKKSSSRNFAGSRRVRAKNFLDFGPTGSPKNCACRLVCACSVHPKPPEGNRKDRQDLKLASSQKVPEKIGESSVYCRSASTVVAEPHAHNLRLHGS